MKLFKKSAVYTAVTSNLRTVANAENLKRMELEAKALEYIIEKLGE